jgi:hypothetical protein
MQERDAMRNADGKARGAPRAGRRLRIRRIVIVALLLAALVEPLVMYRTLMREREERRTVAEASP